jgi:hypothetical protein
MREHNRIIAIIIFCALLAVLPFETGNATAVVKDSNQVTPSAIDIIQMIPDPYLESEPDVFINGTSDEFQYSYQPNLMQLNWTHTAGTSLNFRLSDNDYIYPYCNDFVYFTQSFDWQYEVAPSDAGMELNWSTSLTGSFDTEDAGTSMFMVYAWIIDSSGNWVRIYRPIYPYSEEFQETLLDFNYNALSGAWGGVIEDEHGVQEDPSDTLRVAIGLAPTDTFREYSHGIYTDYPWQTYNGSVIISISSVELYVVMDAEPDPITHLTPLYNESYGAVLSDIYQSFTTDPTTPLNDRLYAMTTDTGGNVYITGYSAIPYEIREETGISQIHQFLIKYNPRLECLWIARNLNQTAGRAISFHDDYIYTTGDINKENTGRDLIVTKWASSGTKIWQSEWNHEFDQFGEAIGVHSDGSIYVVISNISMDGIQNSSIIKLDDTGAFLWNKTLPFQSTYPANLGSFQVFENYIYCEIQGRLVCLSLEGDIIWEVTTEDGLRATADNEGMIYAVSQVSRSPTLFGGTSLEICQINLEGNVTWNNNYEIVYDNGWIENSLGSCDITLTPTGEIAILGYADGYDDSYFLLKYSNNGTFIQSWSIGTRFHEGWPEPSSIMVEVATTGLLYVSMNVYTFEVLIQAYVIGNYTLPSTGLLGSETMLILALGGGIGAVIVAGVVIYKKKRS